LTSLNRALRWSSTYPADIIDNTSSGSRQGHGAFGSRRVVPPHRPTVLRLAAPSSDLGLETGSNIDSEQGSDESVESQDELASSEERLADPLRHERNDKSGGVAAMPVVIDTARRAISDADSSTENARAASVSLRVLQGDSKERRQSLRLASFSALLVPEDEAAAGDSS
jgi:hypothetical protein